MYALFLPQYYHYILLSEPLNARLSDLGNDKCHKPATFVLPRRGWTWLL